MSLSETTMSHEPGAVRPSFGRSSLLTGLGILALLLFYVQIYKTRWVSYSDLDQIYMAGVAWNRGVSPYNGHLLPLFSVPNGPTNFMLHTYYYSPLCGMFCAPLALLPFPLAVIVWKFGVFSLLLYGFWRFLRVACPEVSPPLRWLLLGLTALSGSVRWNLVQLQPSALAVGLLLLFACAVIENRPGLSVALGVLISFKMTYLFPVLGLLLFRRQYKTLGALLVCLLVLNGLSLLRTGPGVTLTTYRSALQSIEDPGKMTRPDALDFLTPYLYGTPSSPLASQAPQGRKPGEWAGEQIHLPFIVSAWGLGYTSSKRLGLLFSLALLLPFALLWKRVSPTAIVTEPGFQGRLFAALMATTLLIVYHQRYDTVALIVCGFVAVAALLRYKTDLLAWATLLPTVLLAYLLSGRALEQWHTRLVIPHGWLILVPLCGYLTLWIGVCAQGLLWRQNTIEREG